MLTRDDHATTAVPGTRRPPMIERERERWSLAGAVGALSCGQGQAILLEGPAGIGKTRLLDHVRELAGSAGATVLRARANQVGRDHPFDVVRQLFEHVLDGPTPQLLVRLLANTARPPAHSRVSPTAEAQAVTDFTVLHGLYRLAATLARSGPLVLLIDDLHWADQSSMRFIAHLLPRLDSLPILLVLTSREQDSAPDLLVAHIATDTACSVLHPAPLTVDGCAQLLRTALGSEPDPAFTAACNHVCAGNPSLLNRLIRLLAARGVAATAASAAQVFRCGSSATAVRIGVWLHRLPVHVRAVAQALAVLGQHPCWASIATVSGVSIPEVYEAVHALQRSRLVRVSRPHGSCSGVAFVHPIVRTAVRDAIPWPLRVDIHRRASVFADDDRCPEAARRPQPGSDQPGFRQAGFQPDRVAAPCIGDELADAVMSQFADPAA